MSSGMKIAGRDGTYNYGVPIRERVLRFGKKPWRAP